MKQKYTTLVIYNVFCDEIFLMTGHFTVDDNNKYTLIHTGDSTMISGSMVIDNYRGWLNMFNTHSEYFIVLGEFEY